MTTQSPASPVCLAHEAEDSYMGFASREEIVCFLTKLDMASAAAKPEIIRCMLPKIRDDALHAELSARLAAIDSAESAT